MTTQHTYAIALDPALGIQPAAVGLLTNYLYDLIKGAFAERPQPPGYAIHVIDQPGGTQLIVIVARNS